MQPPEPHLKVGELALYWEEERRRETHFAAKVVRIMAVRQSSTGLWRHFDTRPKIDDLSDVWGYYLKPLKAETFAGQLAAFLTLLSRSPSFVNTGHKDTCITLAGETEKETGQVRFIDGTWVAEINGNVVVEIESEISSARSDIKRLAGELIKPK